MKIELRHRKLASGNDSLYLDFYEKGKRYYESLNLFLIPERTENDRRVNENTLKHALKIKAERILGVEKQVDDGENTPINKTNTQNIICLINVVVALFLAI